MAKIGDRGEPLEPAYLNNAGVGIKGWGVTTGLAVTASLTPDMTVIIGTGQAHVNSRAVSKTNSTTLEIASANATYPLYHLITLSQAGTVETQVGTLTGTISYAQDYDLEGNNRILLAELEIPANDTTISQSQITDKRTVLQFGTLVYTSMLGGTI